MRRVNKQEEIGAGPETSVIIPVYNGESFIKEAVESVLTGIYTDFEIIIVDDGSEDDTLRVCESLKDNDERVKILSIPHRGVSAARNTGLDAAGGKYVAFVDADDIVTEDYLKILTENAKIEEIDYVASAWIEDFYDVEKSKNIHYLKQSCFDDAFVSYGAEAREKLIDATLEIPKGKEHKISSVWMSIYRKSIIDDNNLRFREDIIYGEDTLFIYSYAHYIRGFAYVDEPMYVYRRKGGSSSDRYYKNNFVDINAKLIDAIDEEAAAFGDSDRDSVMSFKLGQVIDAAVYGMLMNEAGISRDEFEKARRLMNLKCKDANITNHIHNKKAILILWLIRRGHYRILCLLNGIRKVSLF